MESFYLTLDFNMEIKITQKIKKYLARFLFFIKSKL